MLGAILATYSDEKLKSIQLSLQEEQEIRAISREEVEKALQQSGLASMADALKDDIEKGIVLRDDILYCILACSDSDFKYNIMHNIYPSEKECILVYFAITKGVALHATTTLCNNSE